VSAGLAVRASLASIAALGKGASGGPVARARTPPIVLRARLAWTRAGIWPAVRVRRITTAGAATLTISVRRSVSTGSASPVGLRPPAVTAWSAPTEGADIASRATAQLGKRATRLRNGVGAAVRTPTARPAKLAWGGRVGRAPLRSSATRAKGASTGRAGRARRTPTARAAIPALIRAQTARSVSRGADARRSKTVRRRRIASRGPARTPRPATSIPTAPRAKYAFGGPIGGLPAPASAALRARWRRFAPRTVATGILRAAQAIAIAAADTPGATWTPIPARATTGPRLAAAKTPPSRPAASETSGRRFLRPAWGRS